MSRVLTLAQNLAAASLSQRWVLYWVNATDDLAYTVPCAIGNILLTVWGPVVVAIIYAIRS